MPAHNYAPPEFDKGAFHCPHCHTYSVQRWGQIKLIVSGLNEGQSAERAYARCDACDNYSIWINKLLIYPRPLTAPEPSTDLPEEIRVDFEEARTIAADSPRAAAALLRLCIQKLCIHLGQPGKNLNDDIGALVANGLPAMAQKSLDVVRVVGNHSVHPGQMSLEDTGKVADKLFGLVNLVVEVMITQPKHVQAIYNDLVPEGTKDAIAHRDGAQ